MNDSFDSKKFQQVWKSLNEHTRLDIKAKAAWEHMSLSAVMRDYYPKLWKLVKS